MNNIKNAFYNTLKTISTVLFPLITIPYVSRVLASENIGKINFSNSIISYFLLLASLGVSTYAMRECSKIKENREQLEKVSSEIFSINILSMLFSYIALLMLVLFSEKVNQYSILVFILSINIIGSIVGADWLNMAVGDFKYIALRTFALQIISLGLMFLLVRDETDYIQYAVILVISNTGASIANIFYRKRYCNIKFTFKLNLSQHFKPIVLLFSLLLAQTLLSNIDITVLGFIRTDSEVGMYSMAVKIYTTVEKIISSIAFVLIPEISNLYAKKDYEKINQLLSTTWNLIKTFSIPMAVGLAMLSREIIAVACGKEYAAASISLSILAIAMLVNLFGGSFWGNLVLLPGGHESRFMIACCISAAFNFVANYLVIPVWGMNGAAFTTMISAAIILIICSLAKDCRAHISINKGGNCPIIIGTLCIIATCALIKCICSNEFIILGFSITVSFIIYLIILYFFKNEALLFVLKKISAKLKRRLL